MVRGAEVVNVLVGEVNVVVEAVNYKCKEWAVVESIREMEVEVNLEVVVVAGGCNIQEAVEMV